MISGHSKFPLSGKVLGNMFVAMVPDSSSAGIPGVLYVAGGFRTFEELNGMPIFLTGHIHIGFSRP